MFASPLPIYRRAMTRDTWNTCQSSSVLETDSLDTSLSRVEDTMDEEEIPEILPAEFSSYIRPPPPSSFGGIYGEFNSALSVISETMCSDQLEVNENRNDQNLDDKIPEDLIEFGRKWEESCIIISPQPPSRDNANVTPSPQDSEGPRPLADKDVERNLTLPTGPGMEEDVQVINTPHHECHLCHRRFKTIIRLKNHLVIFTHADTGKEESGNSASGDHQGHKKVISGELSPQHPEMRHVGVEKDAEPHPESKIVPIEGSHSRPKRQRTKKHSCQCCKIQCLKPLKQLNLSLSKNVKCQFCGRGFKEVRHLRIHLAVHRRGKRSKGHSQGHNKDKAGDNNLRKKMPIRRPHLFQCPHCEGIFGAKIDMKRHINDVHPKIRHTCTHPNCGANFGLQRSLERHEMMNHSNVLY